MKLSAALLVTALSAALLVTPVVSNSNADAADSIVDLTAADQSANSDQHKHEQRELWPYFKKECCELECKPKCGTDEEENCREYAEYEYGACCVSIAKETAGTHTCKNDPWVEKKCKKMSDDALDKCKAHCWGDEECFKVCHPCGYDPDGGYKPD